MLSQVSVPLLVGDWDGSWDQNPESRIQILDERSSVTSGIIR